MPKAYDDEYDDENEFTSEPARQLVRLGFWERIAIIISGKYAAIGVALLVGSFSLVSSLITAVSTPPLPERPLARLGATIQEDTLAILKAHDEILKTLGSLPDSDAKQSIAAQLDIINRSAGGLKAMGDSFTRSPDKRSSLSLISPAQAQATASARITPDDVRLYGIIVILLVLGAAFLLCIGIILFSDHARRLTFAIDTVKVLMGFFVGVATSFFGVR